MSFSIVRYFILGGLDTISFIRSYYFRKVEGNARAEFTNSSVNNYLPCHAACPELGYALAIPAGTKWCARVHAH